MEMEQHLQVSRTLEGLELLAFGSVDFDGKENDCWPLQEYAIDNWMEFYNYGLFISF